MKLLLPDRVATALLVEMANGSWNPGMRFLSHRQIKRYWKVSTPTTSLSLQKLVDWGLLKNRDRSGHYLSANFRQRALRLLNESSCPPLPRQPGWQAKLWKHPGTAGHSRRIAVILVLDEFPASEQLARTDNGQPLGIDVCVATAASVRGILRAAPRSRCDIDFYADNGDDAIRREIASQVIASGVQGVIIVRRMLETGIAPLATTFLRRGLPVVTAYDDCENTAMLPVNFNNVGIGHTAAQTFMKHGHRRIGVLLHQSAGEYFDDRLRGCQLAVQEAGGDSSDAIALPLSPDCPQSVAAMIEQLRRPTAPTALLATRTELITVLQPGLAKHNIRIPHDLSVIVCSSTPNIAGYTHPFDIMHLDFERIGITALRILLNLMNGKSGPTFPLVRAEHICYNTVGPPPAARA